MRRSEFEVRDTGKICEMLDRCETVRIGMVDNGRPYVVPLSFGYECVDGEISVYVHGARAGRKFEVLGKNSDVCVEADIFHNYVTLPDGGITVSYESVIGFGEAELLEGEEAIRGLKLMLAHTGHPDTVADRRLAAITAVFRIKLSEVTGKSRIIK